MPDKKTYLVIGVYEDNLQRYADSFITTTALRAEREAQKQAREEESTELIVAAVIEGNLLSVKIVR